MACFHVRSHNNNNVIIIIIILKSSVKFCSLNFHLRALSKKTFVVFFFLDDDA